MKKRIFASLLLTAMFMSLVGCGTKQAPAPTPAPSSPAAGSSASASASASNDIDWPTRAITLYSTGNAGGSADATCRCMAAGLEKYLGVSVTVANYPGAGGWNAANEVLYSEPDGYRATLVVFPALSTSYLDPSLGKEEDASSFKFLTTAVNDPGVLMVNYNDERFPNFDAFLEYAKTNEVTVGTTGVASDDDILLQKLRKAYPECQFTAVHFTQATEVSTAVMGGHVDAGCGNVGDTYLLSNDKEVRILGVAAEKRSTFLPDQATFLEIGHDIVNGACRGFAYGADIDPAIAEKMADAMVKALNDPEIIEMYASYGMEVDVKALEDFDSFIAETEQTLLGMADIFGWEL